MGPDESSVPLFNFSFYGMSEHGFVNVFSSRATGFHRRAKLFELNFFLNKTFLKMVQLDGQNRPRSKSICPVLGP